MNPKNKKIQQRKDKISFNKNNYVMWENLKEINIIFIIILSLYIIIFIQFSIDSNLKKLKNVYMKSDIQNFFKNN